MFYGDKKFSKDDCPLLKAPCAKDLCPWYIHIAGKNPQTGAPVDDAKCAIAWMPIVMLEVAQKEYQTGAAVESLRNEAVKAAREITSAALAKATAQILTNGQPLQDIPALPHGG